MAVATIPGNTASIPANGWWAVQSSNGAIGVQKGAKPPTNSIKAVYVGAADTLSSLVEHFSTGLAGAIGDIGGSASQQSTLVGELDNGASIGGAKSWLFVGPNNSASSDAPVTSNSEAVAANVIPSPSLPSVSILGVLGNISLWKGLGLVIAGFAILIFAGIEFKNMAI